MKLERKSDGTFTLSGMTLEQVRGLVETDHAEQHGTPFSMLYFLHEFCSRFRRVAHGAPCHFPNPDESDYPWKDCHRAVDSDGKVYYTEPEKPTGW